MPEEVKISPIKPRHCFAGSIGDNLEKAKYESFKYE
jgi:hypothetical protein